MEPCPVGTNESCEALTLKHDSNNEHRHADPRPTGHELDIAIDWTASEALHDVIWACVSQYPLSCLRRFYLRPPIYARRLH